MNPNQRFCNEHGVTIVELMVVIAVAGILAAVAAPTVIGAMKRERARGFAHEVANSLREARNQAMSRGEALKVWVRFDSLGNDIGEIRVWRVQVQLPGGGFGSGNDCSTDAYSCPDGEVCVGGLCQAPPPRSCAEMPWDTSTGAGNPDIGDSFTDTSGGVSYRYTVVARNNMNRAGAGMGIRWAGNTSGGEGFVCMSPRGSIERPGGGLTVAPGPPYTCPNEAFNVWVFNTEVDWAVGRDAMACDATPDAYEEVSGYIVRAMPNGEISFRPPRRN